MSTSGICRSFAAFCLLSSSLAAQAVNFDSNLIVNGDAEGGLSSWTAFDGTDLFQSVAYGNEWVLATEPGPVDRGSRLFAGQSGSDYAAGYQLLDVKSISSSIAQGAVSYTLSGYLGGHSGEDDNAVLYLSFLDLSSQEIGSAYIGPLMDADRSSQTGLLFAQTTGIVPIGTAQIQITLSMERLSGFDNDGYADNLSFQLSPVPEPQTYSMLLLGLGGLAFNAFIRRRRD